jgi:hypothetical protein
MIQFFQMMLSTQANVEANIFVYAMIGQSNMDGRGVTADLPAYMQGTINNCYFWNGSTWLGLTANNTSGTGQVGPIGEFAYRMQEKYPTKQHYFVFEAQGGTSLAVNWEPGVGANYLNFQTKWNAAMSDLAGESYATRGACWMQGERDSVQQDYADAYEVNEQSFVSSINALISVSNFIDGRIHNSLPIGTYPYFNTVRTAKDNNYTNGYTNGLIDSDAFTLKADSIHFDTGGAIQLGNAFSQYF